MRAAFEELSQNDRKRELSDRDWRALVDASLATRDVEIGCDDCLDQVATYAEVKLAGLLVPEALRLVEEHLAMCDECGEEFQALADVLRDLE